VQGNRGLDGEQVEFPLTQAQQIDASLRNKAMSSTFRDPFFVLADFDDYMQAQSRVDAVWLDRRRWTTMSLLNTARSGFFSSDRAIRDYASSIWNVHPLTP
jgi:glucan phosphorylase